MRPGVIDGRMVVDQPATISQIEAVERALGAFAVQDDHDVVPDERTAKIDRVACDRRCTGSTHIESPDVRAIVAFPLQLVMIDPSVLTGDDLSNRIREVPGSIHGAVTFNN